MQKHTQNPPNGQTTAQQQNISINISYNLNTTKMPKSILGTKKQTSKSKKINAPALQSIGNQFFSNIGFNPLNEGKKLLKKENVSKKSNQPPAPTKQPKPINDKKVPTKKKKSRQVNITEPSLPQQNEPVMEYYNPLANNSKHFLKRNIQSPDIFKVEPNRKLKTEASNYEPNESTFKKMKRSAGNSKETHSGMLTRTSKLNTLTKDTGFNFIGHKAPSPSINTMFKKPTTASSKTPKNSKPRPIHPHPQPKQKRFHTQQNDPNPSLSNPLPTTTTQSRHNKSCMLYSSTSKKPHPLLPQPHLLQTASHLLSTFIPTSKAPRKRAQSAYSFTKNGKELVSKLLNMSMISSELSSSQLISSERVKSSARGRLKVDQFGEFNHYQKRVGCQEGEEDGGRNQGEGNFNSLNNSYSNNRFRKDARELQEAVPGNALRQYLNSIDLRIIKNIESDTANIVEIKIQDVEKGKAQQNNQKNMQKDPFKLNLKKNTQPQPFTNPKEFKMPQQPHQQSPTPTPTPTTDMIQFYNNLFTNALHNKRIQEQQQKYMDSANLSSQRKSLQLDFSKEISPKVKRERFVVGNEEEKEGREAKGKEEGNDDLRVEMYSCEEPNSGSKDSEEELYQFIKVDRKTEGVRKTDGASKPEGFRKLNFQHYKDLLINKQAHSNTDKEQQQEGIVDSIISINNSNKNKDNTDDKFTRTMNLDFEMMNKQDDDNVCADDNDKQADKQFPFTTPNPHPHPTLSHLRQQHIENHNHHRVGQQLSTNPVTDANGIVPKSPKHLSGRGKVRDVEPDNGGEVCWEYDQQEVKGWGVMGDNVRGNRSDDRSRQGDSIATDERIVSVQQQQTHQRPDHVQQQQPQQRHYNPFTRILPFSYHPTTTNTRKLHNTSPNNISQDGHGSGQEQYDSKKYSQVSAYHDNDQGDNQHPQDSVVEDDDKMVERIRRQDNCQKKMGQEKKDSDSLIDSLEDDQEEEMSLEEREIYSENRWVVSSNTQKSRSSSEGAIDHREGNSDADAGSDEFTHQQIIHETQGRVRKFMQLHQTKIADSSSSGSHHLSSSNNTNTNTNNNTNNDYINNNDSNYLQCQLSSFALTTQPPKPPLHPHSPASHTLQPLHSSTPQPHQQTPSPLTGHFKLTINGKQTSEKITLQVTQELDQPQQSMMQQQGQQGEMGQLGQTSEQAKQKVIAVKQQQRRKRLTHIVQDIILQLIREFAKDISYILKKSSYDKQTQEQIDQNTSPFRSYQQHPITTDPEHQLSPFSHHFQHPQQQNHQHFPTNPSHHQQSRTKHHQQLKKQSFVGKCFGIDTSFVSVQKYLKEFREYLLKDEEMKRAIVRNINKDIGPNSLEILSYLRPEYEGDGEEGVVGSGEGLGGRVGGQGGEGEGEGEDDEDGLFVVPSEAFSQFQSYLQAQIEAQNKLLQPDSQILLSQKQKRNTNFWHRGIYQSWNQFLDYQRPYGINGKPYEWVKQRKKFRQVTLQQIQPKLQKGIDKLLQAISLPSGIIYDKYDLPSMYLDLNEQQKMFLNEERLSRMLAIELFESEETWINYNDEMAELLVELGRIIEDRIFFQVTTEVKRVARRRGLVVGGGMEGGEGLKSGVGVLGIGRQGLGQSGRQRLRQRQEDEDDKIIRSSDNDDNQTPHQGNYQNQKQQNNEDNEDHWLIDDHPQ